MPKKMKTTKSSKSSKTAKTVASRRAATHKAEPSFIERVQTSPIEVVKDVASKSLYLSLGLAPYLWENPEEIKIDALRDNFRDNLNSFVNNAINKGEKIEKEQIAWLSNFEREQRKRVKAFLTARKKDLQRTETSIEEKIEEVIAGLDIPTRNDIHQLNRRLNDLTKKLERQRATNRKTTKRAKHAEVAETSSNATA
jgi:polyhydroxyalkanoate synthesis regulator phasin